jgi:hypothetical protein
MGNDGRISAFMLLFIWGMMANAQTLQPVVIGAGGSSFSNAAFQLSYTVGEAAVTTLVSGAHILTQGFHQPSMVFVGIAAEEEHEVQVRLYPNPTQDYIRVDILGQVAPVNITLVNLIGQTIYQQKHEASAQIVIDLSGCAAGMYLMRLSEEGGRGLGVYRIEKMH